MFGSASGRAGSRVELSAFMADKEHCGRSGVNRRLRSVPADYWMGGLGRRLLPGSMTKV